MVGASSITIIVIDYMRKNGAFGSIQLNNGLSLRLCHQGPEKLQQLEEFVEGVAQNQFAFKTFRL